MFERHPFTRQAFIPMGTDKRKRAYVVIVAEDNRGKPDLDKVKAFIVMGNMGIVYEANRWHSPMCALDEVRLKTGGTDNFNRLLNLRLYRMRTAYPTKIVSNIT